MNELSLKIITKLAERTTIQNINGEVSFRMKGDLSQAGKTYLRPVAGISEEVLEKVTINSKSEEAAEVEVMEYLYLVKE